MRIKEEPQEEEEDEEEAPAEEAEQQQQPQPEVQTPVQVKQEDEPDAEKEVKQEDEKPCSPPDQLQEKEAQPSDSAPCPLKESPNPPGDLTSLCRSPDGGAATVATATASAPSPTYSTSKPTLLCSTPADSIPLVAQFGAPPPQFGIPLALQHHQHLLANDQLLRVLTERGGHWFSLLPRSPCDESSLVQPATPLRSSAQPGGVQPRSPPAPSCSPHQHLQPPSASSSPLNAAHDGLGNLTVSPLQVRNPISQEIPRSKRTLCVHLAACSRTAFWDGIRASFHTPLPLRQRNLKRTEGSL